MYASTSTIRPTRRLPSGSTRTRRQPRRASATSRVGRVKTARTLVPRAGFSGPPPTAASTWSAATGPSGSPGRDVERLDIARDQQPEQRDESRDQARPEQVRGRRWIDQVEQAADPRELGVALRLGREPEERVQDDDHEADEEQ